MTSTVDLPKISADAHVDEPHDLWYERLSVDLRDHAPRRILANDEGGWSLVVDGNPIDDMAVLRVQDKIRRVVLNGQTVLDRDASRYLVGAGFSSARDGAL